MFLGVVAMVAMVAVVTSPQLLDVVWCSAAVVQCSGAVHVSCSSNLM